MKNARKPLSKLAVLALLALSGCGASDQPAPNITLGRTPPNIVFIMADDLGYGHLGSYGQQKIETPNINRLAAEGMRFTQAYAGATVCAPSRSVLMTGLHGGAHPDPAQRRRHFSGRRGRYDCRSPQESRLPHGRLRQVGGRSGGEIGGDRGDRGEIGEIGGRSGTAPELG